MSEQESSIPLSERELQVLQMVAKGASNQQIAHQLVISINTVKVHLRNIFEKLEVQSRTEASLRAIQEGWVSVSENGSAESAQPLAKSFLLAQQHSLPLRQWQQIYLTVAILLMLAILATPLLTREPVTEKPYLPLVIAGGDQLYQQAATPTPLSAANTPSSRWRSHSEMTVSRAGLGLAVFDHKIYAIGGVKTSDKATRFVEIFDPATNSWEDGSAKPTAVANIGGAVLGDKIYVPGGCTNDREAIATLEIYHPESDSWSGGPALPAPRCGYGLTTWNDTLYLFGGWNGQAFTDSVFTYSPEAESWQTLNSTLPSPSGYMGVATLGDTIFVVGGYDGQRESEKTYAFDPSSETWTEKTSMQERRGGLGLVSATNYLYAVGGGWNNALQNSEKYDARSDTWSTFETPYTDRWRNLGVALVDTELYVVGGWNGTSGEYMADTISYNIVFQLFLPVSKSDANAGPTSEN